MEIEKRSLTNSEKRVVQIALRETTDEEKIALNIWAQQMLQIRLSNDSKVKKGIDAIKITSSSKIIIPILKIIAKELKLDQFDASKVKFTSERNIFQSVKQFWGKRSLRMKVGLSVATVTAIVFAGQGAGIAALGGAIGVPLWAVFGGGSIVLMTLIEEISGNQLDNMEKFKVNVVKQSSFAPLIKKLPKLRRK